MKEAIDRLINMLVWSDRIGSDETYEIEQIIKILNEQDLVKDEPLDMD